MAYTLSQFISNVKCGNAIKVKCIASNSIYPVYIGNQEIQLTGSSYYDLGSFHTAQTVLECYGLRRGISDGILIADEGTIELALASLTPETEIDVNIQDQTTRPIDAFLAMAISAPLTLAANTVPDTYTFSMTAGHGIQNNDFIGIFSDGTDPLMSYFTVLNVATNTITIDAPMDNVFDATKAVVFRLVNNMAIDGSSARKIFLADNLSHTPFDITRIVLHVTDDTQMDDGKFGGITKLTKGCVLRLKRANGVFENIFTFKSNEDMIRVADSHEWDAKAPSGIYGLSVKFVFGGQDKHGVVLRLSYGDRLEFIIQDNLTQLTTLEVLMQGHMTSGEW